VVAATFVDAYATWFDNPERTLQFVNVEDCERFTNAIQQTLGRRARTRFQNSDAGTMLGRKSQNLSKIVIKRDEGSTFLLAYGEQYIIGGAAQALAAHGRNVVPGSRQ
jgi:hypothetical protein